ncbi:MAG: hypothetical protein ACRDTT_02285 [Pseudonocardiaceae bacterium]
MSWTITTPDGRLLPWEGLHVGPAVLPADELAGIYDRLLGRR